jgi:hypothetical protein
MVELNENFVLFTTLSGRVLACCQLFGIRWRALYYIYLKAIRSTPSDHGTEVVLDKVTIKFLKFDY